MCRSTLHPVPAYEGAEPRSMCYMSFTPNRLVRSAILDLLRVLEQPPDDRNTLTDTPSAVPAAEPVRRKRGRNTVATTQAPTPHEDPQLALWTAQGTSRVDWDARDAAGETEMKYLRDIWPTLTPNGFLDLKQRLLAL